MKLLFICTHNRCRSILAEAITNHLADGRITAASAGSSPQGAVHPMSIKYLQEHGIASDGLRSQSWDDFADFAPDAVLTLCDSAAQEACPVWFGDAVQVHWGLVDPSSGAASEADQRASFNHTIDVIQRRVRCLLKQDVERLSGPALRAELQKIAAQIE